MEAPRSIARCGSRLLVAAASVAAFVATAVLATGGLAVASIPGPDGVIKACYQKSSGDVRVVDSSTTNCRRHERLLTWNQAGAQGPQGPAGPEGSVGPPGAGGGFPEFVGALKVSFTTDGCAPDTYRVEVAREWGDLPFTAGACQPVLSFPGFGDYVYGPFDPIGALDPNEHTFEIVATLAGPHGVAGPGEISIYGPGDAPAVPGAPDVSGFTALFGSGPPGENFDESVLLAAQSAVLVVDRLPESG